MQKKCKKTPKKTGKKAGLRRSITGLSGVYRVAIEADGLLVPVAEVSGSLLLMTTVDSVAQHLAVRLGVLAILEQRDAVIQLEAGRVVGEPTTQGAGRVLGPDT